MALGCDASAMPLTASLDWIEFSLIKRGQSTKTAKQSQAKTSSISVDVTAAVQYALNRRDPPFESVRCHKLSLSQGIFLAWEQKLHQI